MRVPTIRKPFQRRLIVPGESRSRAQGQSLVELALTLPTFLFVVLIGLDFGRAFAGWVTLQQAARIAANYAAVNPCGWGNCAGTPGTPFVQQRYRDMLAAETAGINCDLPNPVPAPAFPNGTGVGKGVIVTLDCAFHLLTPILSAALPNPLQTTASSTFPIKVGFTSRATCADAGNCPLGAIAAFSTLPTQASGTSTTTIASGVSMTFIDTSQRQPTGWTWVFGDGSPNSSDPFPTHTYINTGPTTISRNVTFTACNLGGCSQATGIVQVLSSNPAPIAAFHWCTGSGVTTCNPSSPTPLIGAVLVQLTDDTAQTVTSRVWDFGDGSATSTATNPTHTYAQVATATVRTITLTVTNTNGSSQVQHVLTINPPAATCRVPTFVGNTRWTTATLATLWGPPKTMQGGQLVGGFSGTIIYNGSTPTGQFKVTAQVPTALQIWPCTTTLTVTWQ